MDSKELYLFDDSDLISKQNKKHSKRDDYAAFVEKFKPKKTTDDCYTPENIYNTVADWVANEYGLSRDKFVRPFWPGGDFESFDYPENCVVVDNPPFSIQAKIIRFYNLNNIKFFLFANGLTLFSVVNSCCGVAVGLNMIYQNGAFINTSFLTNLETCAVRSAPTLYKALKIENDKNLRSQKKSLPKYKYPANLLTSSMLAQFSQRGIDFKADSDEVFKIHTLDTQKKLKLSGIFGYAFLLSDSKATEKLKAEKLAADKLAEKEVIEWVLSDREREIIAGLGKSNFYNSGRAAMIDFKEFYKELGTLSSVLSREIIDKFCVALELDDDDKNLLSKRLNNTIPAVFRYIAKGEVREDNEDSKYSTAARVRGILEKYLENEIKEADFKPAVIYRWLIQSLDYLIYTIGNCGTGLENAVCSFHEVKDDASRPNDVRALINHFHRDIMPYVAKIEKLRDLCLVLDVLFKYCEKLF